jgi:probable phosphoglycerate mutase
MTRIVLIRHGETAWNAERRLQGHLDIPLNAEGLRQARAMAAALAQEEFDLVVSSDLARASATAAALADARSMPVRLDPALRERAYGAFEGLLYADIERRYPAEFAAWQRRDIDAVMPHGERFAESFHQFHDRCTGAILAWAARHPGANIAIVAHGGVLECAYRLAQGLGLETPRTFAVKNASINRFTVDDGKLVLTSWGDVAHLEQAALDELA